MGIFVTGGKIEIKAKLPRRKPSPGEEDCQDRHARPYSMRARRRIVEHPFGTIKAWMG